MFTFIIPIRDREITRIKRCLDSLSEQSIRNFSVILVDYGSKKELAKKVEELSVKYCFCKYIYSETEGHFWSRSIALNIGIKMTTTKYCITTDVDMIFHSQFIEYAMIEITDNVALYCQCYYIPKSFSYKEDLNQVDKSDWEISKTSEAYGGCCISGTEILNRIHGFDEFYKIWGVQDTDLNKRLKLAGLDERWMKASHPLMFHQWHELVNKTNHLIFLKGWHNVEQNYFHKNASISRNPDRWGEIVKISNRECLNPERIEQPDHSLKLEYPRNVSIIEDYQSLNQEFSFLKKGELLYICISNTEKISFIKKALNSIVWRIKIDLKVDINKYTGNQTNFINAKDNLLWLLMEYNNKNLISDYYYSLSNQQINAYVLM